MKKVFKKWTIEELDLLHENYNASREEFKSIFPDRSVRSVIHKITNMRLPREKEYERYSKHETQILKDNYRLPKKELMKLLPNRSWASIIQKCDGLGLEWQKKWRFWSKEEEEIILKYDTIEEIAINLPNRNITQITSKFYSMGKRLELWSNEEIDILIDNYETKTVQEISKLLPNRTEQAIYVKSNRLKLKSKMGRFDISDEDIIELYYDDDFYASQIARILGLTVTTVISRLKRNGIEIVPYVRYGEETPSWKGGITSENKKIRGSKEYKQWRISVFERDDYTCQCCGDDKGGNLHAHHIENFSDNPEKRLDVNNGITLCESCHSPNVEGSFHHTYGTRNNSRKQLEEFIKTKQSTPRKLNIVS